jgi:hypothetical protein
MFTGSQDIQVISIAILLPQQFYSLNANVGKSYFENLTVGKNATVTVNNNSPTTIELVFTLVNASVLSYAIPPINSINWLLIYYW